MSSRKQPAGAGPPVGTRRGAGGSGVEAAIADRAYAALLARFWDPRRRLFYTYSDRLAHPEHAFGPEGGLFADFWWSAQLWELAMDVYVRRGWPEDRVLLDEIYDGVAAANPDFAADYNDDMGWWALAALRAHRLTEQSRYLARATELFERIWGERDEVFGGGIWWRRSVRDQKNMATNAPAVMTAVGLHRATGEHRYLHAALTLFDWVDRHLRRGQHVIDRIEADRVIDTAYTYNFGTYVGAALALGEATDDPAVVDLAHTVAAAAFASLPSSGVLPDEGVDDGGGFKAVLVRSLAELARRDDRTATFLGHNAASAWRHRRRSDDLIGPDWVTTPAEGPIQALTAAAGAAVIEAALPSTAHIPTLQSLLEEESGVLDTSPHNTGRAGNHRDHYADPATVRYRVHNRRRR